MPFIKISGLTTATAVSATNQFEINQNGASRSLEVSVLDSYIRSGSSLPVVVSVSSASAAVRITQTGTGNALVVEDSANPDATPFVVDVNGRTLIGGSSPISTALIGSAFLQVIGDGNERSQISLSRFSADVDRARFTFIKSRSATVGTNTIVQNGDVLGSLEWMGADGSSATGYPIAATISTLVDGTPGTNDMPGRLVFATTLDGASVPTERMRIDNAGRVGIGGVAPTARLTVVDATSQDAVRITQTGTGNALVVEDSANPDSSPFVVDANGNVLVGSTTQNATFFPTFQVVGNGVPAHTLTQRSQTTVNPIVEFKLKSNGTAAAPTVVASGDSVWRVDARAYDGANYLSLAAIDADVDGTPGSNDMPGRLVFSTTADGAASPTERMRIASTGNVGIGTASPSEALTVTRTSGEAILGVRNTGTNSAWLLMSPGSAGTALIHNVGNTSTVFTTNGTERMRIDASGNVGIGTASPGARLDVVGGDIRLANNRGLTFRNFAGTNVATFILQVDDNFVVYNAAGAPVQSFSQAAAPVAAYGADGNHRMSVNASTGTIAWVTAGSERMRVDTNGRVGIGTAGNGFHRFAVREDTNAGATALFSSSSNTAFPGLTFERTRAASTAVQSGDTLGVIQFAGFDGSTGSGRSDIISLVDGATSTGSVPTRMTFSTTPSGSLLPVERMRIDASGRVQIGLTSGISVAGATAGLQTATTAGFIDSLRFTADAFPPVFKLVKSRSATVGTNAAVQSGDALGQVGFVGADGTSYVFGAAITGEVDGTPGTNDMPGRLIFSTTADGAASPTERMRITNAGNVGIGTAAPQDALHVNRASDMGVRIQSTAGAAYLNFLNTTGAVVNNASNTAMVFTTNNAERMRITPAGNVLIGTTGSFADSMLTVRGSAADTRRIIVENNSTAVGTAARYDLVTGTTNSYALWTLFEDGAGGATFDLACGPAVVNGIFMSSGTSTAPIVFRQQTSERMRIATSGEVYIAGTTDQGAYNLQVNGTGVWGAGAYVNGSDARIKDDIAPLTSGLDVVTKLTPVQFRYKESWSKDTSIQPGFIAQDLQAALADQPYKEGVVLQGPEYMSVAYQALIPLLTKAIQEQQSQIETLKARVAALENK